MSDDQGRYIPIDVRREVLIEAGHMCAIPTCQYPATQFAHIEEFSRVKEHRAENIIALCPNHHDQYDNKKNIDKQCMRIYKQKLQLLNKRYTKYEMRLLALLAEKPIVVADSEIQTMGLLKDGLIINKRTFMSQNVGLKNNAGEQVFQDKFVQLYAAELTEKGKLFIRNWKSDADIFSLIL